MISAPEPKWIERPVAFIVAAEEISVDELKAHLKERFPSFWVPDRFEVIDELPKTSVGKFDKKRRSSTGSAVRMSRLSSSMLSS